MMICKCPSAPSHSPHRLRLSIYLMLINNNKNLPNMLLNKLKSNPQVPFLIAKKIARKSGSKIKIRGTTKIRKFPLTILSTCLLPLCSPFSPCNLSIPTTNIPPHVCLSPADQWPKTNSLSPCKSTTFTNDDAPLSTKSLSAACARAGPLEYSNGTVTQQV